ncbi:MAG TPA: peptidylprolyl isomerase [Anaerolineales bacterium]|nr:peptidylprolyl isomerase [Anaerolineales bacterium]
MTNPREEKPVLHTKKHLARVERERRQTRIILYTFIGLLVVVAGLIGYAILYNSYLQVREPVAKIGSVNITVGEWQARVRLQIQTLQNQQTMYQEYGQMFGIDYSQQLQQIQNELGTPATLGQDVLNQMVDEELIRQEAAKRGITASKAEVDAAIQASFDFYPNGSPTPTITPTNASFPTLSPQTLALVTITPTPTLSLTATNTPTNTPQVVSVATTGTPAASATNAPTATATEAQTPGPTDTPFPTSTPYTLQGFQQTYQTSLASYEKLGITEDQLRAMYEVDILRQKLMDVITADTPHSQDEIWARHILVADEATANAVRQRLLNGEDFGKVAEEVSTDTGSKDKGGDLGWFPRGTMVPEFEAVAFSLKVGEISQPVKSQFGYHIIQVLAHGIVPLDATAYAQAQQTAFNDWLSKAHTDYKVVTYDNWQNLVPTVASPGSGAPTIIPQ